jgi:hypothetical protein
MSNIERGLSGSWKFDAVRCFDCGDYNLLRNGGENCLKCDSKNLLWVDNKEEEMNIKRFIDKCGECEVLR